MLCSAPTDGAARNTPVELPKPSFETQYQDPHDGLYVSPHSCSYCRRVSVDLRRQHAYKILPSDEQRPKGWRVQPTASGFTFGDGLAAAADGCDFFSFVIRTLRAQGSRDDTESSEITITGTMQGGASLGFSIQMRDHATGTVQHRYNPTQSLDLYTVSGIPIMG